MNALDLLRREHTEVRTLLQKLTSARAQRDQERLRERLLAVLRAHAAVEEELLYPGYEDHEETRDLIEEAYREKDELDEIVDELAHCALRGQEAQAELRSLLDELDDLIAHHVQSQEEDLRPRVEELSSEDELKKLGARIKSRLAELR